MPKEKPYAFVGSRGDEVWLLPQAVIGRHVHGGMDPHAWEDVANAQEVARTPAAIPTENHELITAHDALGYLCRPAMFVRNGVGGGYRPAVKSVQAGRPCRQCGEVIDGEAASGVDPVQ
ncbi:hypothetical protein [Streptomyces sp. Ru62]|uniref:hypothetical protein n=1 Tax=Streptomyces sp. Ru62 TaxID=2080745 RepID=UPI0011AFD3C1|nr:hypothetical protein [Streptomyces sp. Ru62]